MAVIRDNMPAFELFQPASTDDALGLLNQYGSEAWVLAGGLDTWDWLKDRVKRPSVVVDLGEHPGAAGDSGVRGDGLEIGAMAPLTRGGAAQRGAGAVSDCWRTPRRWWRRRRSGIRGRWAGT